MSMRSRLSAVSLALAWTALLPAHAQIAVRNQGYIPYSDAPIYYRSERHQRSGRPAAEADRAGQGAAGLRRAGPRLPEVGSEAAGHPGQLADAGVLEDQLPVPEDFAASIRARSTYNDDVYVGSVHEGKEIEIVSFDARQGAIFYLLHEQKADKPAFERAELDCTQCHIAAGTRGVPGVLLRSV